MKYFFILFSFIGLFVAASCTNPSGGKSVTLATAQDSMYYAVGASAISDLPYPDVGLSPAFFEQGLQQTVDGSATMSLNNAFGFLQQFNSEVREKADSTGQLSDPLTTNLDSTAYAYGLYFAKNFTDFGIDVKIPQLTAGFADAIAGISQVGEEDVQRELLQQFGLFVMEARQAKAAEDAKFYKEEGQQFMATNKEKEGVIEHESGMQYEVLVKGDPNGESPSVSDQVTIHYEGRLLDGTIFDSSIQRGEPITFALSQLVRGWQIALPLMKPGDKWRIYLPSDLAYGDQGSPPSIPPGATLVFDIEYFGKEEG